MILPERCPECQSPLLTAWWTRIRGEDWNGERFTTAVVECPECEATSRINTGETA